MVRQHRQVLLNAIADALLDPVRGAAVQPATFSPRHWLISDVANKVVSEDELALASELGPPLLAEQVFELQRLKVIDYADTGAERGQSAGPEGAAEHGGETQQPTLIRWQRVQAG